MTNFLFLAAPPTVKTELLILLLLLYFLVFGRFLCLDHCTVGKGKAGLGEKGINIHHRQEWNVYKESIMYVVSFFGYFLSFVNVVG